MTTALKERYVLLPLESKLLPNNKAVRGGNGGDGGGDGSGSGNGNSGSNGDDSRGSRTLPALTLFNIDSKQIASRIRNQLS